MNKCLWLLVASLLVSVMQPGVKAAGSVPILSYYPDCDYEVIDTANAQLKTVAPDSEQTTAKLLRIIRDRASAKGAEAIILTAKVADLIHNDTRHNAGNRVRVRYDAELIKLCGPATRFSEKQTPYNKYGEPAGHKMTYGTVTAIEIKTVISGPKTRRKHQVEDKSINFDGSFYGLKLGSSYEEVVEILGDPNVELFIFNDFLVTGYGRNHWLYFNNNRVVKLTSEAPELSLEGKNRVPLINFFDDYEWSIAGKFPYKSTVDQLQQTFGRETLPVTGKAITHHGKEAQLRLLVDKCKAGYCPNAKITGFELFTTASQGTKHPTDPQLYLQQVNSINAMLSSVNPMDTSWEQLAPNLGRLVGNFYLRGNHRLVIVNPNLTAMLKGDEITSFHLSDSLLDGINSEAQVTSLMGYQMGTTYDDLKETFPEDAFDIGYEVQFEQNNLRYELEFYDDGTGSRLFDLKILLI